MLRMPSIALVLALAACALAPRAWANETDNFTCRMRPLRDGLAPLDALMNARIRVAIERANRKASPKCDGACLENVVKTELRKAIGSSDRLPPMFVPHSRFMAWVDDVEDLDRCHLKFSETIYGARSYNRAWLYPVHHRVIYVADSIRLSNRVVGLDKISHFIREGLDHWRAVNDRGVTIAADVARELGPEKKLFAWTERGLKGESLTGVLAYADLAAGYSGFTFWSDVLSVGTRQSFVGFDDASGRLVQTRRFTFADYVTDAWDETINRSDFDTKIRKDVEAAIQKRATPPGDCRALAALPNAKLYVNPKCLAAN